MIRINNFKVLLIAIAFLGLNSASIAQFTGGGGVGVNLSNLRGSSVDNSEMLIGYNIGIFANYAMDDAISGDFGEMFSIQAELNVQQKGATLDFPIINSEGTFDTVSAKQSFTYVQVPVLAKLSFGDPRGVTGFGELGLYGAGLFGLSVDGKKSYDHDNDTGTDERKYRDEYSGFDYGFVVGAGVKIPFGGRKSPWHAFGNARYAMGLANIGQAKNNTPDELRPFLEDVKTSAITVAFGIGYKF